MTAILPIFGGQPLAFSRHGDAPGEARRDPDPESERPAPSQALRILVVDDNLLNQQLAAATVAFEGYEIDLANNGREAVEAVARGAFDLILMDIDMPIMSGLEATRTIRALPGAQRDVWIIAVTGCEIGQSKARCRALGFDDAIVKPYHPDALLRAVNWVDRGRPRHAGLA